MALEGPVIADAGTILALGSSEVETVTVLFYFTTNGQLSYIPGFDGFIRNAGTSSGNIGLSINVDLPTATISSQNVFSDRGFVVFPTATSIGLSTFYSAKFKATDTIKCRNYNSSTNGLQMVLQRITPEIVGAH